MRRRVPTTAPAARAPKNPTAPSASVPTILRGPSINASKDSGTVSVANRVSTGAFPAPSRDLSAAKGGSENTLKKVR